MTEETQPACKLTDEKRLLIKQTEECAIALLNLLKKFNLYDCYGENGSQGKEDFSIWVRENKTSIYFPQGEHGAEKIVFHKKIDSEENILKIYVD